MHTTKATQSQGLRVIVDEAKAGSTNNYATNATNAADESYATAKMQRLQLITSAKKVMFLPDFVCLSVCDWDNSKSYGQIFLKF